MAQRKRLGEILVQAGVLTEAQLRAALNEQRRWGGPLGRVLIDMKLLPEDAMVQALSHQLNLPAVSLDHRTIENAVLDLVPGEMAEQHAMIPFAVQGKFLDVAMVDPTNMASIDELRIKTRLNVRPYLAGPKSIERALSRHYGRGVAPVDVGTSMGGASQSPPDSAVPVNSPMFDSEPMQLTSSLTPTSATQTATARRAGQFGLAELAARETASERTIAALKERVDNLEALVARDEDVLRKLLTFLVQKGLATREEILERIK
jgi:type IV pilus assembly protein PilB